MILIFMPGTTHTLPLWGQGIVFLFDKAEPDADPGCSGLWGSGPSDVYATTFYGNVKHYDGVKWNSMAMPVTEWGSKIVTDLHGIWGISSNEIFALGGNGSILHYDGENWTTMESGTHSDLYAVWGNGLGDVYSVGNHGTILHYNKGGINVNFGWNLPSTLVPIYVATVFNEETK